MIYIVTGFKRSGTSLMMRLLYEHGIDPYFDPDHETYMKTVDEMKNEYFLEHGHFINNGFAPEHFGALDDHAIKIFPWGLENTPKEETKTIYMYRGWGEISKSLSRYKSKSQVEDEYKQWRKIDMPTVCADWDALIVNFNELIVADDVCLSILSEHLGFRVSPAIVRALVRQHKRRNNESL